MNFVAWFYCSSDKSSVFGAELSQSHSMARFASLLVLACAPARVAADILLASFDGKATHSWKQMNDPAPRANFGFITLNFNLTLSKYSCESNFKRCFCSSLGALESICWHTDHQGKSKLFVHWHFPLYFLPVRIFSLSLQVMGGKSTGTFNVENGLGIFDGEVVDVPFLKAPGFIKASVVDMNLGLLICGGEWCWWMMLVGMG